MTWVASPEFPPEFPLVSLLESVCLSFIASDFGRVWRWTWQLVREPPVNCTVSGRILAGRRLRRCDPLFVSLSLSACRRKLGRVFQCGCGYRQAVRLGAHHIDRLVCRFFLAGVLCTWTTLVGVLVSGSEPKGYKASSVRSGPMAC